MKNKSADGLRGIAAFNVVLGHFFAAFLPTMLHSSYPGIFAANKTPSMAFEVFTSPVFSIFYNGHFAVLIFFVLSGYVLTMPYFTSHAILPLQKRLWGRYVRLNIPIASAIALSFAAYKLGFYFNSPAADISGSASWLKNFFPTGLSPSLAFMDGLYQSLFFGNGTFIPPLWTLKIEFIGSVYVLLFYIAKPSHKSAFPITLIFLFLYAIHQADSIYYIAIFAGSCLNAVETPKKWNIIISILGLYFGAFQYESHIYSLLPQLKIGGVDIWDMKTFYNALGAILLTAAIVNGFGRRVFESRLAQFLGKMSFSVYLLHFIVLCSLSCALYTKLPQGKLYLAINLVSYIFACLALSFLFECLVDRKAINLSHRFAAHIFGVGKGDAEGTVPLRKPPG